MKAKRLGIPVRFVKIHASFDIRSIFKLLEIIFEEKIDLVHVHVIKNYWPAVIASKLAGRSVVLSQHLFRNFSRSTKWLMRFADKVICVSEAVKRDLLKATRIPEDKIEVIHNGVDLERFSPKINPYRIREEFNIRDDEKVIGCIGRMGCKGQKEILLAMRSLINEFPNLKLLLVGDYPIKGEPYYEWIDKFGLNGKVLFTGFREDIPEILSCLDIMVFLPELEAFGLAILEAMAMSKPVIATRVGGIPEIIQENVNGILIPPKDIQAIVRSIVYLLRNTEEAKRIGMNARDNVEKNFQISFTVNKISNLYKRVLSNT